jgi:CBS domain-containing protein
MKITRLFTRGVFAVERTAQLAEAAAAMQRYAVGCLLVVEGPTHRAVGIVTDRDLAIQGFAGEGTAVESAMTPTVVTVGEDADTHDALELMCAHSVRRLAVTGADGQISGLLSIDDIVDGLSAHLAAAAAVLKGARAGPRPLRGS